MNQRIGPHEPGQAHPIIAEVARAAGFSGTAAAACHLPPMPAMLAEVALIDAPKCAAAGDMSVSWWHAEVAAGRAPKPVIQRPRCTRWRLADVVGFWRDFSAADPSAADAVKAQASKASAAARAKRRMVPAAQVGA